MRAERRAQIKIGPNIPAPPIFILCKPALLPLTIETADAPRRIPTIPPANAINADSRPIPPLKRTPQAIAERAGITWGVRIPKMGSILVKAAMIKETTKIQTAIEKKIRALMI